jgi:hypothetical protein
MVSLEPHTKASETLPTGLMAVRFKELAIQLLALTELIAKKLVIQHTAINCLILDRKQGRAFKMEMIRIP